MENKIKEDIQALCEKHGVTLNEKFNLVGTYQGPYSLNEYGLVDKNGHYCGDLKKLLILGFLELEKIGEEKYRNNEELLNLIYELTHKATKEDLLKGQQKQLLIAIRGIASANRREENI